MVTTRHQVTVLLLTALSCVSAAATPLHLADWQAKYPTSTLPSRMNATTGSACNVCHHPPDPTYPGNCYRVALAALEAGGLTTAEAIDQLDSVDSDDDGVANGEEATAPRADQPGEVGYNMGLVGPTGTDPCAADPNEVVTGELETPPGPIPTVSEWGLITMTLLLLAAGTIVFEKRIRPSAAAPCTARAPDTVCREFRA